MIPIPILKTAVIVMGVLIVAGLVVVGIKILDKSKEAAESMSAKAVKTSAPAPAPAGAPFKVDIDQLGLDPGARLISMDVEAGRLVLRVSDGDAGEQVLIVDISNGAVLGEVALPPPLQDDLQDYARVYEQAYGQSAKITDLIPSMLEAFMASDSNFKKARKALNT